MLNAYPIANLGEDNKAVEQVIPIGTPPDNMKVQVDFSRRELGEIRHGLGKTTAR